MRKALVRPWGSRPHFQRRAEPSAHVEPMVTSEETPVLSIAPHVNISTRCRSIPLDRLSAQLVEHVLGTCGDDADVSLAFKRDVYSEIARQFAARET